MINRNFSDVLDIKLNTNVSIESIEELSSSVEYLYLAFSKYKPKDGIANCSDCITSEDNQKLLSKPLRELMPKDLEKYGRKALTTWGDIDDLKYFLPRLLEFFPFIGTGLLQPEVVFGKISLGKWREWPISEQKALENYFFALWRFTLSSIETTPWTYSDDILCAISQVLDDISPLLEYWQKCLDLVSLQNLSAFIDQNSENLSNRKATIYWELREAQWDQIIHWVNAPKTINVFEGNTEEHPYLGEIILEIIMLVKSISSEDELDPINPIT